MMSRTPILLLILLYPLAPAGAQQFYIDMRATVQQQDGSFIVQEHFQAPLLEDAFYVSTVRSLPPPDGDVLIESVSEASLISGRLHLRNSCAWPPLSQLCSGKAHWADTLTFDATGLPPGPILLDIAAEVTGSYGPTLGTRYTLFSQSIANFVVSDTLYAFVDYWNNPATTTDDPDGFQLIDSTGAWTTLGPDRFEGRLRIEGGAINTVLVETLINGDTDQDLRTTFRISNDVGLSFTSASGAFLSDLDGDGVPNLSDNCIEHANPAQRDTDGDNFGNRCDPDLDGNLVVNFTDLQILRGVFFSNDPDADFDGDGLVNFGDLQILRDFLFGPPGPTGL